VAQRTKIACGDAALDRERDVLLAAKSPHLVHLVGWGSDDRGGFLLEAPAPGVALRQLIGEKSPLLDGAKWLDLACASARALSTLHALRDDRGELLFVHGDVSPDNLFFEETGGAVFIDLSSATFRDGREPVFVGARGTLPYVAPEIVRREAGASAETDTYALAATLLAVAVGPLTQGTTEASRLLEVGSQGISAELIERRSDLPARARTAIARALRFDRASRLASSRELADEFQNKVG
jgi:serine/threonine protein kinase